METVLHWALGFSDVLPLTLVGIRLTPLMNTVSMVAWPVITWLCVYHGWIKPVAGGKTS